MVNIDERLSKRFAKNVHKIKRSANIRECEDLLLFKRRADIIGLYDDRYNYMKYGVLRLSPEGVFIYSSDHRIRGSREDQYRELIRIITGIGYASSSPISIFAEIKRLPIDDDGVRVTYENEAGSPHQLLLDGTIDPPIPERRESSKSFIEFLISHREDYNWSKLDNKTKTGIVDDLITKVENAFLLNPPNTDGRIRYKNDCTR